MINVNCSIGMNGHTEHSSLKEAWGHTENFKGHHMYRDLHWAMIVTAAAWRETTCNYSNH